MKQITGLFAFFMDSMNSAEFAVFAKSQFFSRGFFVFRCCIQVVARAWDFIVS